MYDKKRIEILGHAMAYVEVGQGDPIVFLHGNPASSFLWRNVIPHLEGLGRCIAPDLIGMGDSDKIPGSEYRFVDHAAHLEAFLHALDVQDRVVLVLHDWGSGLGFDWAERHRATVNGIASWRPSSVPSHGTSGLRRPGRCSRRCDPLPEKR